MAASKGWKVLVTRKVAAQLVLWQVRCFTYRLGWLQLTLNARLGLVAIDSQMRPIPIPQFTPESEKEKEMWNLAQAARDAMKASGH